MCLLSLQWNQKDSSFPSGCFVEWRNQQAKLKNPIRHFMYAASNTVKFQFNADWRRKIKVISTSLIIMIITFNTINFNFHFMFHDSVSFHIINNKNGKRVWMIISISLVSIFFEFFLRWQAAEENYDFISFMSIQIIVKGTMSLERRLLVAENELVNVLKSEMNL